MKRIQVHQLAAALVMTAAVPMAAGGEISAQQLRALLAKPGPHPVLVDVRQTSKFVQGSLPGAINVPARVLVAKKLNFSRGCIIISDGLVDKVDPAKLAAELEASGVANVDYLRGGLAAWSELEDAPTTTGPGATIGRTNSTVTYQDLEKREGGVCLVDLRTAEERAVPQGHSCPVNGFCLSRRFEYLPSLAAFHEAHKGKSRGERAGEGPLVVLIGGPDPDHELTKLHLEGYRRVAVLLGGADIIAVDGRRGKKRSGGAVVEVDANSFVPAPIQAPQEPTEEPPPSE